MAVETGKRTTARLLLACAIVAAGVLVLSVAVGAASGATATGAAVSRLVAIRAAHHSGFDRVVFEFAGAPPSRRNVRYVNRLIADASGLPVAIAGRAVLEASFAPATARDRTGGTTVPDRVAFALPNVMTTVRAGDFESVLSYGIGLAKRTPFHISTLTHPSRVVIEISTPFRTVLKRVYFENVPRFNAGTSPYVTPVLRPVLPSAPATAVMDRMFAGPTEAESASGLRLERSRARSFAGLLITQPIARVRLTGGCSSRGSTFTIADEIYPTLKQFATVDFVKIYDPSGHTERPTGRSDSIPFCLEP